MIRFVLIFFLGYSGYVQSQIATEAITNNASIAGRSDGVLFTTSDGKSAFKYPANSNKMMASLGAFWISAKTNDSILLQASIYNPLQPEFWSGPIDTLTRKSKNPDNWNSVYLANAYDIKLHRENYKTPGYSVPKNIVDWPGNSLAGAALPAVLAPYIDWNLDGLYTPHNGDYPAIKGDNAMYQIYNDEYGEHNASGGIPLKAQVSQMVFNYTGYGMENVVFIEAYIKNMGDYDWKDCFVGFYTDIVLGNPNDNFIRTEVDQNLVYAYNGDETDEGDLGYGSDKPFLGQVWLNRPLSSSTVFEQKMPSNSMQLRRIMEGYTLEGKLKYDSTGGSKFAYPGTSDLNHTQSEISEESLGNVPGKRKMLSVVGPLNVKMGKGIKLEFALFAGTTQASVEAEVRKYAQSVKGFYNQNLNITAIPKQNYLEIYPNPCHANSNIYIHLPDNQNWTVDVMDAKGVMVCHSQNTYNNVIIAGDKIGACGVYYIRASSSHAVFNKKLIIN